MSPIPILLIFVLSRFRSKVSKAHLKSKKTVMSKLPLSIPMNHLLQTHYISVLQEGRSGNPIALVQLYYLLHKTPLDDITVISNNFT